MGSLGNGRRSMDEEYTNKVGEKAGYRRKYKANRRKRSNTLIQNSRSRGKY